MKKIEDKEINKIISKAEEYRKELSKPVLKDFECTDKIKDIFSKCFDANKKNK